MRVARPYGVVLGRNISAARGRLRLSQGKTAARMQGLGFKWQQQTVAAIEQGKRRPTADEILGLAEALETTITELMGASDPDGWVQFPNGKSIHSISLERLAGQRALNDRAVQWPDGGTSPVFLAYASRPAADPFDESLRPMMAAQGWPEGREAESDDDHGT